jgi:hypothetical protein
VLSWSTIAYGAALSAVVASGLTTLVIRPRRLAVIATAGLAAGLGPAACNAILRATHASQFFTDAPVAVLPASWQDTGSGVFALALASVVVGLGVWPDQPGRRTVAVALLCGLAAFLVDVYLY